MGAILALPVLYRTALSSLSVAQNVMLPMREHTDLPAQDREKIAVDISKALTGDKVEMVIVDNTVEAAEHAAKTGLIFTEAIPQIETDKQQDKGEIGGKEELG